LVVETGLSNEVNSAAGAGARNRCEVPIGKIMQAFICHLSVPHALHPMKAGHNIAQ
jgi:hypothetical protein